MKAVDFEDIEIGNKIVLDMRFSGNGFMIFEVEEIDKDENCVHCKDNVVDFYPNNDDQFIIVE